MGTKTRSLGLSSLVVTSLDKGAYEELTLNGWQVPENPSKNETIPFVGLDTVAPTERLLSAVAVCNSKTKKEKLSVAYSFPAHSGTVKKESSSGWRKKWGKRLLILEKDSLSLFKAETSKVAYKSVHLNTIFKIDTRSSSADNDENCVFSITFKNQRGKDANENEMTTWTFAVQNETERDEWRSLIATRAIVEEIANGSTAAKNIRLQHLISECNADLEFEVVRNTPLILFALWNSRKDIVASLLRKGVDARCLLRLDPVTRALLPASELVNLLEVTGRDLNMVGDDLPFEGSVIITSEDEEGGWSLLHHFVAKRDVDSVARLLERIDRPTLNFRTNGGETALSLAVRQLSEHDASEEGQATVTDIIRLLLDHGSDPNLRCDNGDSSFHIVCKRSAELPVQIFAAMENCPILDVNQPDAYGDSPLHILMKMGQMSLAKRLANDSRLDPNFRDCNGDPSLVLAMKLNEESFACFLLTKDADGTRRGTGVKAEARRLRLALSPQCKIEETTVHDVPMHLAIKMHMTSLALKLVEKLPVDHLIVSDSQGRNSLHLAVLHSLLGVAHAIVTKLSTPQHKHLLDSRDVRTGDTPTHLAIRAGRVELTTALLDAGVDMGVKNEMGESCIHVAAKFVERTYSSSGAYSALRLFNKMIEMDSQNPATSCINAPTLETKKVTSLLREAAVRSAKGCRQQLGGQSIIHQACSSSNEQCGLWLLEALFKSPLLSLESTDAAGCTPLACAIENCNAEICKLLISKCSVNRLVGGSGESYLHLCVRQIGQQIPGSDKLLPVIDSLLAHGAYAGYWDKEGVTPLHLACSKPQHVATLKTLLKDRDVVAQRLNDRTETGLTPAMLAVTLSKSPEIVELILEAGADIRLLEPRTRFGLFQLCAKDGFDAIPENQAVCVRLLQLIPDSKLVEGDSEWKARRKLSDKHASLLTIAEALDSEQKEEEQVVFEETSMHDEVLRLHRQLAIECNEKLKVVKSGTSSRSQQQKRTIDDLVRDDEEDSTANKRHSLSPRRNNGRPDDDKSPSANVDDEKLDLESEDEDVASEDDEGLSQRSNQVDRIMAVERYRVEALETAHAWLDSDTGKKMIAQVANVLVSENPDGLTLEAALELAKRNFIEEHVRDNVVQFRETLAANSVEDSCISTAS